MFGKSGVFELHLPTPFAYSDVSNAIATAQQHGHDEFKTTAREAANTEANTAGNLALGRTERYANTHSNKGVAQQPAEKPHSASDAFVEAIDDPNDVVDTHEIENREHRSRAMSQTTKMPTLKSLEAALPSVMVGDYTLLGVLGRGGSATVYRARHVDGTTDVALKVLDRGRFTRYGHKRFKQEIQICRQLNHPNLVRTDKIGTWNEHIFYSMELLEGHDLAMSLTQSHGPCAVPAVIDWTIQACAGLEAAHRAAVIHRDIKPQNIFLSVDGVVKVMDFGIARRAASTITANGDKSIVGTPMYLSPEHLADHPNVDHRTDIYSLGVTMYHLLTDTLPWDTTDLASVFTSILHSEVAAPSSVNDNITPALDAIVMRAMNRDVAERFADCGEMQAALRDLEQGYK